MAVSLGGAAIAGCGMKMFVKEPPENGQMNVVVNEA